MFHAAVRSAAVASLALALAACAPQGDLGRPAPNVLNDDVMPWAGGHAARWREEPVSGYAFTDAEREMRQLGYGLMMPTHAADRVNQFWAELRRTRIGDPVHYDPDPRGYCRTLAREDYRSSKARFIRMTDDMRADRQRIRPFCDKAREVLEADRVREGALGYIPSLSQVEIRSARDRIAENRTIIAWVRHGLRQHSEAYRCALNTQIVATPEHEAVMAERELRGLEEDIREFDRLCSVATTRGGIGVEQAPPRYYPRSPAPDEAIISK
ncbi:hypothetical protein [Phreatobacter oligotrophus]|jgi:hypothetical protein|uniref:hypothetical protein n=1 Tax=Phreatobacter oligotrophus TaxID=1122261 RepID=UPI002354AA83|nr:hypothetical protein [Phreatobacter oligotrophus]MBX9989078.1 hypothetical protein [Phreatobacter oligotrophus]